MLYPGLVLVGLICTVTVVLLMDGSWGKEMSLKNWGPPIAIRHQQDLRLKLSDGYCLHGNEGKRKKFRKPPYWIQELNLVKLKLTLIIGKYDQMSERLNELYNGVTNCGLSNCGMSDKLPEKMKPNEFNCEKFKELRALKKWTSVILSKGFNDSKTYEDQFKELIRFEKKPRFRKQDKNNGSRITILRELQNQIKTLRENNIHEVKPIKISERLNTSESEGRIASDLPKIRKSPTELKIIEWGILQQSKEYLSRFCESLQLVCECWEGRKWRSRKIFQRKNKRKLSD